MDKLLQPIQLHEDMLELKAETKTREKNAWKKLNLVAQLWQRILLQGRLAKPAAHDWKKRRIQ